MRIDAHIHLWRRAQYEVVYRELGRPDILRPLLRDFDAADLRQCLDATGVGQAVLIQVEQNEAHNQELLALASGESGIGAVVGWADLAAVDLPGQLDALIENARFRGIRDPLEGKEADWLARPEIRRGLAELARRGLHFELLLGPAQWPAALALARELPDLPLIINHFGKPEREDIAAWHALLDDLAPLPQVHVKLSGFMVLLPPEKWRDEWGAAAIRPYVERLLERLGPRRLLAATDWPVATLAGPYERHVNALNECLAPLSESERALILGENARQLYGLA